MVDTPIPSTTHNTHIYGAIVLASQSGRVI
jgi:hypothetical protein